MDNALTTKEIRMNRMGVVSIQVNNGIMGGLAAILSLPIGAKQEVKAGSVTSNLCCDLLNQLKCHYKLHEPHKLA